KVAPNGHVHANGSGYRSVGELSEARTNPPAHSVATGQPDSSPSFERWWSGHYPEQTAPAASANRAAPTSGEMTYNVLTEQMVAGAAKRREAELFVTKGCVVTPLARERAQELGILIRETG
ncbi:MAG: hypothetical protein JWN04_4993, partial [Myxococcaceae bacterium]|nr:hypothetical protein [Myxococcaceae bacterium]